MSKKSALPQSRHHVLIYDEDWKFLEQNYGPGSANAALGISGAIRAIIHQRILGIKARAYAELDQEEEQQHVHQR